MGEYYFYSPTYGLWCLLKVICQRKRERWQRTRVVIIVSERIGWMRDRDYVVSPPIPDGGKVVDVWR